MRLCKSLPCWFLTPFCNQLPCLYMTLASPAVKE